MSEDGFLGRWSRLKRAGTEPSGTEPAAEPDPPAEAGPPAEAPMTEAEIAALPPVETITTAKDLAAFLRRGAPPLLRQAALRRMWRINPAIRDYVDDARDYAFDWNAPGGAPGGGMLSQDAAAKLLARLFEPAEAPEAPASAVAEGPAAADAAAAEAGQRPAPMRIDRDAAAAEGGEAAPVPALPRRHGGATPL